MKHAPATIIGKIRRRKIHAIENAIRVIIVIGSLYIFCAFATLICDWAIRAFAITGA